MLETERMMRHSLEGQAIELGWIRDNADDLDAAKFSRVIARSYTEPAEEAQWEQKRAQGALGAFFDYGTFFVNHAESGKLPSYTFIEPAFGDNGRPEGEINSMHAPHDVRPGDRLVAEVYNALRKNEAAWEKTLLILTFDEHGGFYDHVAPPTAPNPDGKSSPPPGDESFAPHFFLVVSI